MALAEGMTMPHPPCPAWAVPQPLVISLHAGQPGWTPAGRPLLPGQCRTWLLRLNPEDFPVSACWPLLSGDERQRADAFRSSAARVHFVLTRAALRLLLAHHLGTPAERLTLVYGGSGKPRLQAGGDWHFNVAHSGDFAVLAVARGLHVGVDIEQGHAPLELDAMARLVFSTDELAEWARLPGESRTDAFFAAWTGKEAVTKALGLGLGLDFRRFPLEQPEARPAATGSDASHAANAGAETPMRPVRTPAGVCHWCPLPAPAGYRAALAVSEEPPPGGEGIAPRP